MSTRTGAISETYIKAMEYIKEHPSFSLEDIEKFLGTNKISSIYFLEDFIETLESENILKKEGNKYIVVNK